MFSNLSAEQHLFTSSPFQEITLSDIIFDSKLLQNNSSSEELKVFVQKHQENNIPFPTIIVEKTAENEFQLKFGALSFMAANICHHEKISALVMETPKRNQEIPSSLSSFDWSHLHEISKAKAYQWFMQHYQFSITQLSDVIKEERSVISNRIRLLQLPQTIQDKIIQGKLSKSHGLTLLRLKNPQDQLYFAKKIEQNKLTIRELKIRIKEYSPRPISNKNQISIHHSSTHMGHIRIPFSSSQELQELLQLLTQICPNKKQRAI